MRNQITEATTREQALITMKSASSMLDHLLEVQRILVRAHDTRKLQILDPLTTMLSDEYLEAAERVYRP